MLAALARSTVWLVFSFVVVVALLTLMAGLPGKMKAAREEAANLEDVSADLTGREAAFKNEATLSVTSANREIERLRRAGPDELTKAEIAIAARRSEAFQSRLDETGIAVAALAGNADRIVASYQAEYIDLPLADRSLSLIAMRKQNLQKVADRKQQIATLNDKIAAYNRRVAQHNRRIERRNDLRRQASTELRNPLCRRVAVPGACNTVSRMRSLDAQIGPKKDKLDSEKRVLSTIKAGLKAMQLAELTISDGSAIAMRASRAFGTETERISKESEGRIFTFIQNSLQRYGWWAFWIVSAGVLLPVAHKLFAFRVIAPLASRTRPVQILARGKPLSTDGSHTAIDIPLDRDTELLVRAGVQSVSSDISACDVLVLKKRMLFTCLAAGLVNLQRLRSDRQDHVTVTAPDADHAEVALINIPNGGAVVLQPRALVGVLKRRSNTLRIERLWRLNFLISWITFQFRYVVFHGPCSLIVQGQRGVRIEEAKGGRMINKRLTLGFDAGLQYGAARSPSLLPYLRGEESLFNDRFTGEGRYLYEQRSKGVAKGTIWGRGLKGLGDTALNAIGI